MGFAVQFRCLDQECGLKPVTLQFQFLRSAVSEMSLFIDTSSPSGSQRSNVYHSIPVHHEYLHLVLYNWLFMCSEICAFWPKKAISNVHQFYLCVTLHEGVAILTVDYYVNSICVISVLLT